MRTAKRFSFFYGVFFCLLFLLGFSAAANAGDSVPVSISGKFDYGNACQVMEQVNQIRVQNGKRAFVMDEDLMEAAMLRAAETRLIFDHVRPDRTSCFTVLSKVNGENITIGMSTVSDAVEAWYNSREHYENMVNGDYQSTGVGCFWQGNTVCWVQLFGYGEAEPPSAKRTDRVTRTVRVNVNYDYLNTYADMALCDPSGNHNSAYTVKKGEKASLKLEFNYPWDKRNEFGTFTKPDDKDPVLDWNEFTLTSSDPSIVTVDADGNLSPKKKGLATITAKHNLVGDIEFSCRISVSDSDSRNVCFYANGGSMQKNAKQNTVTKAYTYGKKYGSLPTPYRKGYTFKGWYTTANSGGTKVTKKTIVNIAAGLTKNLYARWSKVSVGASKAKSVSSTAKAKLSVSWKKVSGAAGYQIQISRTSNFKTVEKTVSVANAAKTSYTFSKLKKPGKKYYVCLRAYKLDSIGNKVYGKYSNVLSVKVKK